MLFLLSLAWCAVAADNVVFVFDASNSMNKPLGGGGSRLEAAVSAVSELLAALPADLNAGLLVYGWRVNYRNELVSCKDLELVYPLQPLSLELRQQMIGMLGEIVAQGKTPLADAMVQAGDELQGWSGENAIVLLSDGEGNCGGDHRVAAHYLATLASPVKLHVVGLDVEPDASETLRTMAEMTGGTYRGVDEASGLLEALYAAAVGASLSQPAQAPSSIGQTVAGVPSEYARCGITNVIVGTEGNDVLYGTEQNDLIYGLGGNDFIIGYGGNDIIFGGPGNDIIQGLEGCDLLFGEAGDDILLGGAGDDQLCGGPGCDSLEGEAGDDCLDGGPEYDRLLGGPGTNRLVQSSGNDLTLEGVVSTAPCPGCSACLPAQPAAAPAASCPPAQADWPTMMPSCSAPAPVSSSECASPRVAKSIDEGSELELHGSVTDEDCDIVSVQWTVARGRLDDPCSLDPVFCAPMTDRCEGEDVLVRLVARDSCGATGEDCFLIHVNNVNRPPFADAGPDLRVDEGATVQLTCSGSDPDGDAVGFFWCDASGRGRIGNPTTLHPMFTVPTTSRCEGEDIVLTLTVTDSCGMSAMDSLVIHVQNVNQPPHADAGPDLCVNEGATVQLTCSASDPDGDPVSYFWRVASGRGCFSDPTALHTMFTAPMTGVCEGEDIVLTLTVTDGCGMSTTDSMVVHIQNVNRPPAVVADP